MASGEAWRDFFTTAAGASATLVGLVIVAISVNIQRILEHPQLPSRGGATVGALVLILVTRQPAGPYLIAGAILATFILSVVNIWVLLVEILR
jgi:presenilin-like A22 family membrane protease